MEQGTLYVVATPLGNLGDLSPRAADVLRQVAVVAAEDTRRSRGLLHHLGAAPRLLSFHAHSPARRIAALLEILAEGRDVALVTDAGTPGISDPGSDLVAAARDAGHRIVPLPGPSALATVLSVAGLPADRHLFLGFIPRKGSERTRLLDRIAAEPWATVLFEAPHRLTALLDDLRARCGGARRAVVARELTKMHEEIRAGTLDELAAHFAAAEPRGEFAVVVEGSGAPLPVPDRTEDAAALGAELLEQGLSRKDAAREIAERLGLARNDAYRLVMELP